MRSRDYNSLEIYFFDSDLRRAAVHPARAVQFRPGVDMYETQDALKVKMELPGLDVEKLSITLSADDRTLRVTGERVELEAEQQERVRCYHLEIYYGAFDREIVLPAGVRFDRAETTAETRMIQITKE